MTNYLYFAVDSGTTLELARKHVAEREIVDKQNRAYAVELGADKYVVSIMDGALTGVAFSGKPHPDFKKADRRGISFAKKGTEWYQRLSSVTGYDKRGFDLAKALGVPTTLRYKSDDCNGMTHTSSGFNSGVGFLYISEDGPFALYVPDIAECVAKYEADGYSVDDACKNFKPAFDGARPILKEEWELTVAQHELEEAKRRVAA